MAAFARRAAVCVASALVALQSFGVSASTHGPGIHFNRVAAYGLGTVAVRGLPAPNANSHHRASLSLLRVSAKAGPAKAAAAPVTSALDTVSRSNAAASAVDLLTGFTGVTLDQQVSALGSDQAVTPPDPQIAAGPTYLLEMVNSSGSVWTKSGGLVSIFDLNRFFPVPAGYTFSDPRVLYDAISGRWFASGVAFVTPSYGSMLVFAVSDTSDPTGTWHVYSADNSANVTHDQPKIGVSTDKVAFSFNDFLNAAVFQGASTWVFGKAAMLNGAPSIPGQAVGPDRSRVSIVPAIELTATSTEYMAYNNSDCFYSGCNAGYPSIGIVALTGDPSIGTLAWTESDPAIGGTSQPPAADQPGLPGSIQTNDDRFLTAVWQNGGLWAVGNDACTPPGDGAVRPCTRLIQVSTAGATVNQNFDLGSTGNDLYYPAVHVNSAGDMFVVYNISSTSTDVGVRLTGQPAGSAPGTVVPAQTVQPGQGLYTCFNRWGDYSGAALDPANPSDVWLVGEYAGASSTNCNWATFVSRVTFAAVAQAPSIASISPNSGPSAGGTTVAISGSNLSASGATTLVNFGATQVTATCPASTSCSAVSPSGVGGPTSLSVTVNGQTSNSVTYTYVPSLVSLSPTSGPASGGTRVTITGSGFSTTAGATIFTFGSKAATGISCSSTTTCIAVAPSGTRGTTVPVRVTVNGVAGSKALSFTYRRR